MRFARASRWCVTSFDSIAREEAAAATADAAGSVDEEVLEKGCLVPGTVRDITESA